MMQTLVMHRLQWAVPITKKSAEIKALLCQQNDAPLHHLVTKEFTSADRMATHIIIMCMPSV
jgi:hypothetical protein